MFIQQIPLKSTDIDGIHGNQCAHGILRASIVPEFFRSRQRVSGLVVWQEVVSKYSFEANFAEISVWDRKTGFHNPDGHGRRFCVELLRAQKCQLGARASLNNPGHHCSGLIHLPEVPRPHRTGILFLQKNRNSAQGGEVDCGAIFLLEYGHCAAGI